MKCPYCDSEGMRTLETRDSARPRDEISSQEIGGPVMKYVKKFGKERLYLACLSHRRFSEPEDFGRILKEVKI